MPRDVLCTINIHRSPVRLNVNGRLLPIRLKSEPETVHVHAHGLTLIYFAVLGVVSTEHRGARGGNLIIRFRE